MHPVLAVGERITLQAVMVGSLGESFPLRSQAPIRNLSILGLDLTLILVKMVVLRRSDRYTADVEVAVHHLCSAKEIPTRLKSIATM